MKKLLILSIFLIFSSSLEAQKKEVKKAQQAVESGNLASAASYLSLAKRIFAAADSKTRAHYYVVEAEMNLAKADLDMEVLESISKSLKLANNYELSTSHLERIALINMKLNSLSAKVALGEFKKKNYAKAASLYNISYQSTQDTILFLKAARSHLLAKEYNNAFDAYTKLFNMGYTDAKSQYVATNVQSKNKEAFSSSTKRNMAVKQGTHKNPEIINTNSKVPEILRGITLSSIHLDKKHAAVNFIDIALAKMPNDEALLNQVLHLYRELDAKGKYNSIMAQLIEKSPNDVNLYYNFAVFSDQSNDKERAKEFYKKALEIDSNHLNALSNLTTLLLEQENSIIDEMNNLKVSASEDKRYDELLQNLKMLYIEVLPYLERIVKKQPQDNDRVNKLKSINSYIGQDTKLVALKDKSRG